MQQWHFITCHMFSCYSDCCEGWREEDRHSLLFILISPCIPSLRHDEVKCLTVNRVSGVSLPEMIPLCDSDSDSCQPRLGTHAPVITRHPLSKKILMWHNINIRDVTHDIVILQIKAPAPSHLLDLSRVVTGWVRYPFILLSLDQKRSVGRRDDERIFIWLDKYTWRLISWQIIIERCRGKEREFQQKYIDISACINIW